VKNIPSLTKVLVADDSAVSRKLIENAISSDQFALVFAKTGQEAIEQFAEHKPRLAILDWMMPDRTGLELCQHIRAASPDSYTYIVLLTGLSEKKSLIQGLASGADDYLTKPFDDGELLARLGVGMRVIELHQQIEAKNRLLDQLAHTDTLTNMPNRRAVEEWASRQISGAARYGFPFWVAVADLDHFKKVNDTHGHEAGDTVLKKFAEILKAHSRKCDICGRLGGEEFLFALTHTSAENAKMVIERIRTEFEGTKFNFAGACLPITASFGVAGFAGTQPPEFIHLLAQADAALYSAKGLGRNRVEFAPFLVANKGSQNKCTQNAAALRDISLSPTQKYSSLNPR
jgi:two-component system cell cycle response regulator